MTEGRKEIGMGTLFQDEHRGPAKDLARIVYTQAQIRSKVGEIAAAIEKDYREKKVLMVGVLNGCFPFLADLVRAVDIEVEVDFMSVSSYGGGMQSSGVVRILKDLNVNIQGRHVLVVEDIIDSGLTARYLLDNLLTRRPASIEMCALLDKRDARVEAVPLRYVGFECPNEYLVGYGLDYNNLYRNLPFIGVLKPEVMQGP
jgi:hypoxanthine phosphoribosyltransferase